MKEIIETLGNIAPLLTAVFGVSIMSFILSLGTSLSYDSFDMRLLPRDKFALIKLKQFLGTYLFIISVFCLTAFLFAYQAINSTFFFLILFVVFCIVGICMFFSQIIFFMEFIIRKTENYNRLSWVKKINKALTKLTPLYKINDKIKVEITLVFLILVQTAIAWVYIANFDGKIISLTKYLALMFGVGILIISSLLSEKKYVDYVFIGQFQNTVELSEVIGTDNSLLLDYFLTESIGIFSTKNKEYKVIKRITENCSTYEVYKRYLV